MRRKVQSRKTTSVRPRFRIFLNAEIAIGPGKAELLQAIADTGSIQAAARSLKMSYMRSWQLVHTMNECFRKPLVETERGGRHSGGASLTPLGFRILELYNTLEAQSLTATRPTWKKILKELK